MELEIPSLFLPEESVILFLMPSFLSQLRPSPELDWTAQWDFIIWVYYEFIFTQM